MMSDVAKWIAGAMRLMNHGKGKLGYKVVPQLASSK